MHGDIKMNIEEAELVGFIKIEAVDQIKIVQLKNQKYKIIVNLTCKEGDYTLATNRKKIREWANLDRLTRHIRENYNGHKINISLSLQPLEGENKETTHS